MIVSYDGLTAVISATFEGLGMSKRDADWMAHCLTVTEAKGVFSHGVQLVKLYADNWVAEITNHNAQLKVLSDAPAALRLGGDNGVGQLMMRDAMELAIERAKTYGSVSVAISDMNHYGAGLPYAEMAAEAGMIFSLYANAIPTMAPFGAKKAFFGTNPVTYGVPAGKMPPFILDMATSIGAGNKLIIADREGKPAPEGWGIDRNGNPCTDPREILDHGCLLPFGGPKGSGLAGFGGLVSIIPNEENIYGLNSYPKKKGDRPHFGTYFQLTDMSKFVPMEKFQEQIDAYLKAWVELPPAKEGSQVMYPGYIEAGKLEKAKREGISLLDTTYQLVIDAAAMAGVDAKDYLS